MAKKQRKKPENIIFRADNGTKIRLRKAATAAGVSYSEIIRRAICAFFTREAK